MNGRLWMVKYPKAVRGPSPSVNGGSPPYAAIPLSEYIGSRIYRSLGIPAQQILLGIRNGVLVVACEDIARVAGSSISSP